jgi:chromosome segregation protein
VLAAVAAALSKLLESEHADLWPPVIDAVTVEPGYELALGAALGDDLTAATDEAAPVHWRGGAAAGGGPALPAGAEPLGTFVTGPAALDRRLAQIGVVPDGETGRRLERQLQQGQRLVTADGAFWRWDGYSAAAEAPTAAGVRLGQRNRLAEIRGQTGGVRATAAEAHGTVEQERAAFAAAEQRETRAREAARAADGALAEAREARAALDRRAAENRTRIAALIESAERIAADLEQARAAVAEIETGRAELPDAAAQQHEAGELRAEVAERRAHLLECQSAHDNLKREMEARRARLDAIAAELQSWSSRQGSAEAQLRQLSERRAAVEAERGKHAERPTEIVAQRIELLTRIEAAETGRNARADRLAEAETTAAAADRAAKDAQAHLSAGRENRVRAEAAVEQAKQALDALAERIADRLKAGPDRLREIAELDEDKDLPDLEATERRVERLLRERENMGPVNLRAEQESRDLSEQIETMDTERADLVKAIEKLRHGISELNREGRQRLLASFEEVDKHFQELFVRLFGGGRAHLKLTDSDDPLEAGLEIMASPPGKRLQVLSLLSGGEQALTALALLFAVFLTNPAPICVLDEVDAPLDDANVDRFCSLVEEIAHSLSTRFLVITHHRMTMARMDRLYGVTMAEQGVSQLVSVDLGEAEQLRATA